VVLPGFGIQRRSDRPLELIYASLQPDMPAAV
jgi:hypothetical protein